KVIQFSGPDSAVPLKMGIFSDRDGTDEQHTFTLTLAGAEARSETVPIVVHDQDKSLPLLSTFTLDFGRDATGFMSDATARSIIQQAADDWAYFLDDMRFESVPAGDESTFIWNQDGFVSGTSVTNQAPYTGFLLYAYGIHSGALRSGGEGS